MKKRLFRLGALCCVAAMTITTGAQALSVEEAYDILQRSYVDKLPRAAQDAKSLDELFSYTDDYTYYMTAEEYQAFLQGVEGDVSFAGIGAEITYVPEGIRIVSVLKGGGAEKAGLAAGDIIIAIESESCAPGGAEHRAKLLGEAGTSVTVTVRHADGTQADYTVTRALVTQTNTTVSVTGGVGYIDCDSFGTQTGTYFQEGVRGNDSAVHAWIVDLRGNGGGLTSAAVFGQGRPHLLCRSGRREHRAALFGQGPDGQARHRADGQRQRQRVGDLCGRRARHGQRYRHRHAQLRQGRGAGLIR